MLRETKRLNGVSVFGPGAVKGEWDAPIMSYKIYPMAYLVVRGKRHTIVPAIESPGAPGRLNRHPDQDGMERVVAEMEAL